VITGGKEGAEEGVATEEGADEKEGVEGVDEAVGC